MVTTWRKTRRWALAGNLLLVAGLVAALVLLFGRPPGEKPSTEGPGPNVQTSGHRPEGAARPLSDYAVIWSRPLRRPLYDPKPEPKPEVVVKPPELHVTLVGTVLEEGFSYGLFRTRSGETKMVSPGGSIDGAFLVELEPDHAVLTKEEHRLTLPLKKD